MGWALGVVICLGLAAAAAPVTEVEPNDAVPQSVGGLSETPGTIVVQGEVGYAGDLDWYSFVVTGDASQTVRLALRGNGAWQLVLFTDDLASIGAADSTMIRTLAPAVYRLRVQRATLDVGEYVLWISNALESESNDGLSAATPLGELTDTPLRVFAAIEPAGDVDFFSFVVPSDAIGGVQTLSQAVRIEAIGDGSGDSLILLYAWDAEKGYFLPVDRDDDSGPDAWSRLYLFDPAPGMYVVRVHEYADNETVAGYELQLTPITLPSRPLGAPVGETVHLGALSDAASIEVARLLRPGEVDEFSFTVSSDLCVRVSTAGPVGGGNIVCLYDDEGNEIVCSDRSGDEKWSGFLRSLAAGEYVITVAASKTDRALDYALTIETAVCPASLEETEPNDDDASAQLIPLPCEILGALSPNDVDVFTFTLAQATSVTIETSGSGGGDTYLCLYGEGETSPLCDDDGGADLWSRLSVDLEPGTYWITVELYAGDVAVSYVLTVQLED
jgi:hypothetical protein